MNISIEQVGIYFANGFLVLGTVLMFSLLSFQYYLYVKIRTTQLKMEFKWFHIFYWKYSADYTGFKDVLWDNKYDSIFNMLIKSPFYFFFVDLGFKREDLKKLDEKRTKVCKLAFLTFGILMIIGITLQEYEILF